MIKKIYNIILDKYLCSKDREYLIGEYYITLPACHKLDFYQREFKNYDKKLPIIAALVSNKYHDAVIVDIGANVGDTAAAIRTAVSSPIICVEGNSDFLKYLNKNFFIQILLLLLQNNTSR